MKFSVFLFKLLGYSKWFPLNMEKCLRFSQHMISFLSKLSLPLATCLRANGYYGLYFFLFHFQYTEIHELFQSNFLLCISKYWHWKTEDVRIRSKFWEWFSRKATWKLCLYNSACINLLCVSVKCTNIMCMSTISRLIHICAWTLFLVFSFFFVSSFLLCQPFWLFSLCIFRIVSFHHSPVYIIILETWKLSLEII